MAEPHMYHAETVAEYLQIFPRYCVTANAGGGTTFSTIRNAAAAIDAGLCETVLISMADSLRSGPDREKFGMRGRIVEFPHAVSSARQDIAIRADQCRAHRHFAARAGGVGFIESDIHMRAKRHTHTCRAGS